MDMRGGLDQIHVQEPYGLLQLPYPAATFDDLHVQVLQLALRLEEGIGAQRDLLDQVQLHHVQVMRELLLQHEVLGGAGEGADGPERGAVLQGEVLLEVERRDLPQAGHQGLALAAEVVQIQALLARVVAYVLEPLVGFGDRGQVGLQVGSGHVAGGLGRQRDELRRCDGGGRRPPADPRAGIGGIGVVEDGRQALAAATTGGGCGIGVGIGSAWGPS